MDELPKRQLCIDRSKWTRFAILTKKAVEMVGDGGPSEFYRLAIDVALEQEDERLLTMSLGFALKTFPWEFFPLAQQFQAQYASSASLLLPSANSNQRLKFFYRRTLRHFILCLLNSCGHHLSYIYGIRDAVIRYNALLLFLGYIGWHCGYDNVGLLMLKAFIDNDVEKEEKYYGLDQVAQSVVKDCIYKVRIKEQSW